MEILIDGVCQWSVSRMNLLTDQDQIDNATSIYYEFAEWLDPDFENEVVAIDDMTFKNQSYDD